MAELPPGFLFYSLDGFNPVNELTEEMQNTRVWNRTGRVVCLLRSGEILLEFDNQKLVCYDPTKDEFKNLNFDGLPNSFASIAPTLSPVSLNGARTPGIRTNPTTLDWLVIGLKSSERVTSP
ncbi:hypothetical protein Syun_026855 [Stephania yunnanensis]|uniref:Uncharacterized protein n=1 Tax=Stephania yunnanensis TaxID=152371 RepID=A0AAP0ENA8_9MAGN